MCTTKGNNQFTGVGTEHLVICFIILHYKDYKITARCIDSLIELNAPSGTQVEIVVVDNASCNGSFEKLCERYCDANCLHLLRAEKNLGFAKGNNLAFDYSKHELNADVMIILNNDTKIVQSNFLHILTRELEDRRSGVIYPDVFDAVSLRHQSPLCTEVNLVDYAMRQHTADIIAANKCKSAASAIKHWLKYLLVVFPLTSKITLKILQLRKIKNAEPSASGWQNPQEGAVGVGAAIILNKGFISALDYAFYPRTFMYYEECIQKLICMQSGLHTRYAPSLRVEHYHQEITKESALKPKNDFSKYAIESFDIFMGLLNDFQVGA